MLIMKRWEITDVTELAPVVDEVLVKLQCQDGGVATVLALHGDLGAGKTTFTQTVAKTLGVQETVTSPTFVIMKGYETTSERFEQLVHIDAYRIEEEDEMRPLHFKELLGQPNTLICIEWAEKITNLLPDTTQHLTFSITDSGRIIELS